MFFGVNFLNGFAFVARSSVKCALKWTRPKKLLTSDADFGLCTFFTASTFGDVGPIPFSDKRNPMNSSSVILYTHLSEFNINPFACIVDRTFSSHLSRASTESA